MLTWPYYTLKVGRAGQKSERYPYLVVYGLGEEGEKTVAKCKRQNHARMLCHLCNRMYRKKKGKEFAQ